MDDITTNGICKYEGERNEKGEKHGKGKLTFEDGDTYEGEKNNLMHGHGVFKWGISRQTYQGDFEHDKITGKGVYTYPSGERYEGTFRNGYWHGQGKMIMSATRGGNTVFEGTFLFGCPIGWTVFLPVLFFIFFIDLMLHIYWPEGPSIVTGRMMGLLDGIWPVYGVISRAIRLSIALIPFTQCVVVMIRWAAEEGYIKDHNNREQSAGSDK